MEKQFIAPNWDKKRPKFGLLAEAATRRVIYSDYSWHDEGLNNHKAQVFLDPPRWGDNTTDGDIQISIVFDNMAIIPVHPAFGVNAKDDPKIDSWFSQICEEADHVVREISAVSNVEYLEMIAAIFNMGYKTGTFKAESLNKFEPISTSDGLTLLMDRSLEMRIGDGSITSSIYNPKGCILAIATVSRLLDSGVRQAIDTISSAVIGYCKHPSRELLTHVNARMGNLLTGSPDDIRMVVGCDDSASGSALILRICNSDDGYHPRKRKSSEYLDIGDIPDEEIRKLVTGMVFEWVFKVTGISNGQFIWLGDYVRDDIKNTHLSDM